MLHPAALPALCVALLAGAGCTPAGNADDSDGMPDAMPDAMDGSIDDSDAIADAMPDASDDIPDAMPDAGPPPPCGPSGEAWAVDPDGPDRQIHPAIAADGDGVWVAYNRVTEGLSTFDVFVARLDCAGQPSVPPTEVSTDRVFSDVDPSIAVGADAVLVAWTNDVSDADPNLLATYRLLDRDGAPLGEPTVLVTDREGAPFGGGQWMVQVAALDEGFVIVGARGVDARNAFQVFAQRIDGDGQLIGPTASAERDMTQQLEPDVAVDDEGSVWIGWGEGDQGAGDLVVARWAPPYEQTTLQPGVVQPGPGGSVRMSVGRRVLAAGIVARNGGADVVVRLVPGGGGVDLGERGQVDVQPAVAQARRHGIVAWFRRIRGNRAGLWVQSLDTSGALRTSGPPRAIALETDAAPYPMAIAPLADGRAAIAWTGGEPPAYRVFLRVEAP